MLRDCLHRADEAALQAAVGRFPFWHVAYHTLFFTDLYLSRSEQSFRPPSFHREDYQWLGVNFAAPDKKIVANRHYNSDTLIEYVDICREKAKHSIGDETETSLSGVSGFSWLEFTRLETHLYNIRHIQHHTGQLSAALQRAQGEGSAWVSSDPL